MTTCRSLNLARQHFPAVGVRGDDEVELRVLQPSDITTAYLQGMNDPELRRFVALDAGILDKHAVTNFVTENWVATDCLLFGIFAADVHVGNVRLHDYHDGTIWLGIAVFAHGRRGRGLGTRVLQSICQFAFTVLSCSNVKAGIDSANEASRKAFRYAGFIVGEHVENGVVMIRHGGALGKLALGTVNFGLVYGRVPGAGQVPPDVIAEIVATAFEEGVEYFDTAFGYGTAESVLGEALKLMHRQDARVISKVAPLPNAAGVEAVLDSIRSQATMSVERLGVPSLEALLLHRASDLNTPEGPALWDLLETLKAQGATRKIGVSVYEAKEIDDLLARRVRPDVIQLPMSVADQRLHRSGHLQALGEQGIEVHVRSIFLQGVLLAPEDSTGRTFAPVKRHIAALQEIAEFHSCSPAAVCMQYVAALPGVERIVVGCNSTAQLRELITAAQTAPPPTEQDLDRLAWPDARLLNPSNWPVSDAAENSRA